MVAGVRCAVMRVFGPMSRSPAAAVFAAFLVLASGMFYVTQGDEEVPQSHERSEHPMFALFDTLDASRDAGPGEAVAGPLRAIAEAHAVPVDTGSFGDCPKLDQAIALHKERLGAPSGSQEDHELPQLPAEAEEALACLLDAVHQANLAMDRTFEGLERQELLRLYQAATEKRPLDASVTALLDGRDHSQNLIAAIRLAERVDHVLALLHALKAEKTPLASIDLAPILRFAPEGADHHERNYALIVDLEGDDVYSNHAGGIFAAAGGGIWDVEEGSGDGVSLLGQNLVFGGNVQDADVVLSSSLVLDLSGDDTYGIKRTPILKDEQNDCTEEDVVPLVGTIGSGAVGTGMLFDLEGDDTFTGRTLSQGAGHVLGVGVLYNGGGHDRFEAIRLAQGSGLLGGIGLLVDNSATSDYLATSPQGGVWNGDLSFCDDETRYTQGSAFDRRPGPLLPAVGILANLEGDDTYTSKRKSHGFGQGPGLGLLYDAQGDDTYVSTDLAQGAAQGRNVETHPQAPWGGGLAMLFDRRGDDTYTLIGHDGHGYRGQGYSLGQEAEDPPAPTDLNALIQWAVDRREAIGLHMDEEGTDRYQGPPGREDDTVHMDGVLGLFYDQTQTSFRQGPPGKDVCESCRTRP